MIDAPVWEKMIDSLREKCPRLTEEDLEDAGRRIDLLTAKIQNRHWVSRVEARRLVLELVQQAS